MKKNKKAFVEGLTNFVIGLMVLGFIVALSLVMTGELKNQEVTGWNGTHCIGPDSGACNATDTLITETGGISDWYGIMIVAAVMLVLFAIIMVIRKRMT